MTQSSQACGLAQSAFSSVVVQDVAFAHVRVCMTASVTLSGVTARVCTYGSLSVWSHLRSVSSLSLLAPARVS